MLVACRIIADFLAPSVKRHANSCQNRAQQPSLKELNLYFNIMNVKLCLLNQKMLLVKFAIEPRIVPEMWLIRCYHAAIGP